MRETHAYLPYARITPHEMFRQRSMNIHPPCNSVFIGVQYLFTYPFYPIHSNVKDSYLDISLCFFLDHASGCLLSHSC